MIFRVAGCTVGLGLLFFGSGCGTNLGTGLIPNTVATPLTISQKTASLTANQQFSAVSATNQTLPNSGWTGVPLMVTLASGKILVAGGLNTSGTYLSQAELFDPATGLWTTTGAMNVARNAPTTVLFSNGLVLAVGGYGSGAAQLSTCEIYDPGTGVWTPTGSLNQSRVAHTTTLLPNGTVLVYGGFGTNNAELYDPSAGTWSYTGNAAPISPAAASAVLLPSLGTSGKVLFVGGSTFTTTAYLYDVALQTWTTTGSVNSGRKYSALVLFANNTVLYAGGSTAGGKSTQCELYNVSAGTWSITAPMAVATNPVAQLLPNGKLLAIEFPSSEIFNPADNTWSAAGSPLSHPTRGSGAMLPDGRFLLFGYSSTLVDFGELFSVYSPIAFTATGGVAPYTYRISSGSGSITSGGVFNAAISAGVSTIEVRDALGEVDTSTVTSL